MLMLSAAVLCALVATMRMHDPGCTAAARTLEESGSEPGAYGDASSPDAPTAADFVVIGGGTAGCALAARICENLPEASIVVLDRSVPRTKEEELFVRSPRLFFEIWGMPGGVVEAIETEPNPGLGGRTLTQLTGRTLGGSSAINGAQWTKPPLATFDSGTWGFAGTHTTPICMLLAIRRDGHASAPLTARSPYSLLRFRVLTAAARFMDRSDLPTLRSHCRFHQSWRQGRARGGAVGST